MFAINEMEVFRDDDGYFTCKAVRNDKTGTYVTFHQETGDDITLECKVIKKWFNGERVDDEELQYQDEEEFNISVEDEEECRVGSWFDYDEEDDELVIRVKPFESDEVTTLKIEDLLNKFD